LEQTFSPAFGNQLFFGAIKAADSPASGGIGAVRGTVILRHRGSTLADRLLFALAIALAVWLLVGPQSAKAADPTATATKNAAAVQPDKTVAPIPPAVVQPASPAGSPSNSTDSTSAPQVASGAAPTVASGEVKPEVYYIRYKDGRLVPVPGLSYDDFIRLYRLKEKIDQPEAAPRFSLEQMTLTGAARGDRVELAVVFKVLLSGTDWVRVPLRLNKCVLRGPAEYKGAGEELLQPDPSGEGYVCWIRGAAHSEHQLTLNVLAPLTTTAEESRLELNLPRAAASKLTVRVSAGGVMATASQGAAPPEVTPAEPPATGSDISLLGVGGDCWLAWRESDQPIARLSSALEATGAVLIRIDGRSVNSDATLSVRSFGAEFDHFHVRLPRGAELVGGRQDGYTLTALSGASSGLVEVKLDHKTTGPVDVRLLTERAYDVTKPSESLELAGFAVTEAIPHRQWGYLAVAVAGDWQLAWGEQTRVRQVSDLPDSLRRKDLAAAFEYFGQPNSLSVRVLPRKTRISVEPQYIYAVREDEVRLDARFDYTIRGAKLFQLDVELPGWELDRVRPEGLIDVGAISTSPTGMITLPLIEPATGDIELTLTAHRQNSTDSKSIAWTLPQPRADVVGPAEVAILPADNIELTPLPAQMTGLGRSTGGAIGLRANAPGTPPTGALPSSAPPPTPLSPSGAPLPPAFAPVSGSSGAIELSSTALFYRAEQARATFAADFAVRPQDLSVELDDQVSIHDRDVSVVQSINYMVRYVPLERLKLDVPRELLEQHQLKFVVGKEVLQPQVTPAETEKDRTAIELPLSRPIVGALRLEVSYSIPQQRLSASSSAALDLPLAIPRDGNIVNNSATISAQPGIRIDQREGPWNAIDAPPGLPGADSSLRLTASDAADGLRLAISRDDGRLQSATFVDRAWIQSWLTESVRQDRVVYLFSSNEDQLRLELPAGISAADVELMLDGQPLAPVASPSGPLIVVLPPDAERREHLLELRYQFEGRGPHNGSLVLEAPKWDNHVKIRRTYWQLLLPSDEHLVKASGDLTAEYDWTWNDDYLGFRRVPLKDDAQLEQWVGLARLAKPADASTSAESGRVTPEPPDHPEHANRYLFSTAGQEGRFEVVVIRRWLLLLVASTAALAIGLALIYFPALRETRALVAAAAVALILAIIYPEPALLFAQAGSLGVLLVLAALVLRGILNRPPSPVSPTPISGSSRLERSSTRLHSRREPDPEPATTATSPVAIESPSRTQL